MLETLVILAISVLAFLLARRIFRRGAAKPGVRVESPIEAWARDEVARILSQKLDVEPADLGATLGGNPDPDVVTRLERSVKKVEVVYERVPGMASAADVRVEVSLEDGKLERSIRRIEWDDLPAHVKDELAATGASQVFRPFMFPWQS